MLTWLWRWIGRGAADTETPASGTVRASDVGRVTVAGLDVRLVTVVGSSALLNSGSAGGCSDVAQNTYYPGNTIRLRGTYKVNGTLTNPSSMTIYVEDPNGNEFTYSASVESTGVYYYDYAIGETSTPGVYTYGVKAVSSVNAYDEATFRVKASKILGD